MLGALFMRVFIEARCYGYGVETCALDVLRDTPIAVPIDYLLIAKSRLYPDDHRMLVSNPLLKSLVD